MKKAVDFKLPNLKGQKVLITGGLGFIGSNLALRCLELGARVTIYDCLDPHSGGNRYNINKIKDSLKLVIGNILDFDRFSKHIKDKDILFNCCASTSHPFSMREPLIDLDINGRGVIHQLEAARRFNPDIKFIHIGTSTQIGKLHYRPANENHPEFPLDIYSANKSVSEKYALIYAKAYNMHITVVRLPNVFGPRASIDSPDFTFVNYFIGLALQGKDITVFGEGKQLRNVLYVDDCITALIMVSRVDEFDGEVFFAVGDKHYSIAQIASTITKHIGGRVRFVKWPQERKVIEVGDAVIANEKIKENIGWHPVVTLENGLEQTKKYYASRLKYYLK